MRVALLADFPVHTLPGFEKRGTGHHATWLPPLTRELEARTASFEFHWITCTKAIAEPRTLHAWNQTFHLIPRRKLSLEMLTAFRRERRLIARLLRELKPDFVHGWGTEQGYGYAANDFPGPSLISLQGILQTYCKAAHMPWLTRLQAIHEARVLARAKNLTVESPWGQSQLRHLAPQATIDLLEYGVDPACFEIRREIGEPVPQSPAARCVSESVREKRKNPSEAPDPFAPTETPKHRPVPRSCGEGGNTGLSAEAFLTAVALTKEVAKEETPRGAAAAPLALFVGSLSQLKGVDTLLAAFSAPRLHHIDLVVLGGGNPEFTRRPLPSNIRFIGHVSQAEVREWMSKAWCLVHPTRADTSPNCVKEARVIGLPVVTTPNGGQTQYVEHGKSGYIHEAGDTEGLIQGVLCLTSDLETNLRMGTHGQADCREALKPETTATRLLDIYRLQSLQR